MGPPAAKSPGPLRHWAWYIDPAFPMQTDTPLIYVTGARQAYLVWGRTVHPTERWHQHRLPLQIEPHHGNRKRTMGAACTDEKGIAEAARNKSVISLWVLLLRFYINTIEDLNNIFAKRAYKPMIQADETSDSTQENAGVGLYCRTRLFPTLKH
eukprot:GHVU01196763.1.p3 GENE.GHVU01196763.1~~GHVU01196763.1.p3  ORF type:complete len:154 (-),score=9.25 GHVU01196763.1:2847-3308(-)